MKQLVGIKPEIFKEIVEYLSNKPHKEVAELINKLNNSPIVNIKETETEAKDETKSKRSK